VLQVIVLQVIVHCIRCVALLRSPHRACHLQTTATSVCSSSAERGCRYPGCPPAAGRQQLVLQRPPSPSSRKAHPMRVVDLRLQLSPGPGSPPPAHNRVYSDLCVSRRRYLSAGLR
jgi:hypothetical protein